MLFVSAFARLGAFAQSGRSIPPPPSTPTPTPQTVSPNQEAKRSFVVDRSADTYKLVFETNFEGENTFSAKPEKIDFEKTWRPWLDNFVEQLNKAGAQGYKFTSVIERWQPASGHNNYPAPVAILKLDEVQHEYAWFVTTSESVFTISGFEQKYTELTKRGFHLADHFLIGGSCRSAGEGEDCKLNHLFLLEREKGVEKLKQFILASSPVRAGFKFRNEAELTAQIKEKLADGFYPSDVFSKWEILLSQTENTEEPSTESPDVQVVMHLGLKSVQKKVNELAKQGYRLLLVNSGIAVMYRRSDTATPVSYIWLNAKGKEFEKELAQLQAQGAVYRMTYPDEEGKENNLIFEQKDVDDGTRREYEVLKFGFQVVEDLNLKNGREKEVHIDLTPASKETIKLMNSSVKDGFVVRDLFLTDKPSVLLERSR